MDVMRLCAALRIEVQRGWGYCARRLVIDHGVNVSHVLGPHMQDQRKCVCSREGAAILGCRHVLQWDGVISGHKAQNHQDLS